jgi:hypothetical protein
METPLKGHPTLARLCTSSSIDTSKSKSATSSVVNSPQTGPSHQAANLSVSPSGSLSRSGGGIFPGPNCKCLLATLIVPFMDEKSLIALMRTCKRIREITSSDEVWEQRLKDMRVNTFLINRTNNFFRAFRSDVVTLRGLEGYYDFEGEEGNRDQYLGTVTHDGDPVSPIKKVMLTIAPAFLGFVTPVARVCFVVQYFGMVQEDVFEGTMRYSFSKRLFVMSTFLTRAPRQEGPKFDVVVARSFRKWGTQKPSHFESVRGGTRLIISISQAAQAPANGYLPTSELLTVSRLPREGEGPAAPLPHDSSPSGSTAITSGNTKSGGSSNLNASNLSSSIVSLLTGGGGDKDKDHHHNHETSSNSSTGSKNSSSTNSSTGSNNNTEQKRFSFRSLLGGK